MSSLSSKKETKFHAVLRIPYDRFSLVQIEKLHNQFGILLHNPFETAKTLGRENRVENASGHGNGSRRSDLASLMFELFTTTSRETTDVLTSP
ncbi:hypothetical protein AVEN_254738-1 [Araneus ventricosus]|uniref:Uncharacterized protein n=1 Tax=Araneus ventricosus TaxID=182803 RepID=A0A4Y2SDZ5_ARAVE|nr:hypothetical protein AVEN_254738-1 [Araneus ventricosus]